MQHEMMWTINKEMGEGVILLGEYITINKAEASSNQPGAGSYLAVGQNASQGANEKCGARNNVYTRDVGRLTTRVNTLMTHWVIEANSSDTFTFSCDDDGDKLLRFKKAGEGNDEEHPPFDESIMHPAKEDDSDEPPAKVPLMGASGPGDGAEPAPVEIPAGEEDETDGIDETITDAIHAADKTAVEEGKEWDAEHDTVEANETTDAAGDDDD